MHNCCRRINAILQIIRQTFMIYVRLFLLMRVCIYKTDFYMLFLILGFHSAKVDFP